MKRDDLIIDVGAHRGEDTAHYLACGFSVVAVEANPNLVAKLEERFAGEIEDGRLVIVGAAVAAERGRAELAVSDDMTVWSSLDPGFISRNEKIYGTRYRTVEVPAVRFAALLAEYGVPHYLKIDVEGADMLCVRALREMRERPNYLSIESAVTSPGRGMMAVFEEFRELLRLGYRRFKFIDQSQLGDAVETDASGPFGEQTSGQWMPAWRALGQAAVIHSLYDLGGIGGRWSHTKVGKKFRERGVVRPDVWYDLHAKLGSPRA